MSTFAPYSWFFLGWFLGVVHAVAWEWFKCFLQGDWREFALERARVHEECEAGSDAEDLAWHRGAAYALRVLVKDLGRK